MQADSLCNFIWMRGLYSTVRSAKDKHKTCGARHLILLSQNFKCQTLSGFQAVRQKVGDWKKKQISFRWHDTSTYCLAPKGARRIYCLVWRESSQDDGNFTRILYVQEEHEMLVTWIYILFPTYPDVINLTPRASLLSPEELSPYSKGDIEPFFPSWSC